MQMFRNAWQLNLAELQAKFILGEKIVFERELWMELCDEIMSSFDLHVSSGASLLAFKIRSVGGS